jgi:hypothetical protein
VKLLVDYKEMSESLLFKSNLHEENKLTTPDAIKAEYSKPLLN